MNTRFVAGVAAVLFALQCGALAFASSSPQSAPTPAPTAAPQPIPTLPPTGGLENAAINAAAGLLKATFGWNDNESLGTVSYYRGYTMQLKMNLNRYRSIQLHKGTVINPRGYSIKTGDVVDVRGRPQSDGSLLADMIVVQGH